MLFTAIFWTNVVPFLAADVPRAAITGVQAGLRFVAVGYLFTARSRSYF